MISVEYREALVEVLEVLDNTDADLVNKIPKKFMEFMKNNASRTYQKEMSDNQNLNDLTLKEKTKDILTMIYRNYWCTLEQRSDLDKILDENEEKYQEQLREKYNPDNLFKKNTSKEETVEEAENTQIIEYKPENIFQKIWSKLKNLFHKRKK